jgi:hypothetical protein
MKRKLAALVAALTMLVGVTAAINVPAASAARANQSIWVLSPSGQFWCSFNVNWGQTLDNRPYAEIKPPWWNPKSVTCQDTFGPVPPAAIIDRVELAVSYNQWPYFSSTQSPLGYEGIHYQTTYGPYGPYHTGACVRFRSHGVYWSNWVCADEYT